MGGKHGLRQPTTPVAPAPRPESRTAHAPHEGRGGAPRPVAAWDPACAGTSRNGSLYCVLHNNTTQHWSYKNNTKGQPKQYTYIILILPLHIAEANLRRKPGQRRHAHRRRTFATYPPWLEESPAPRSASSCTSLRSVCCMGCVNRLRPSRCPLGAPPGPCQRAFRRASPMRPPPTAGRARLRETASAQTAPTIQAEPARHRRKTSARRRVPAATPARAGRRPRGRAPQSRHRPQAAPPPTTRTAQPVDRACAQSLGEALCDRRIARHFQVHVRKTARKAVKRAIFAGVAHRAPHAESLGREGLDSAKAAANARDDDVLGVCCQSWHAIVGGTRETTARPRKRKGRRGVVKRAKRPAG